MNARILAPAVLALACASSKPAPDPLPTPPPSGPTELGAAAVPAPPRPSTFNAKVWVGWQETALDCEASARAMRSSNPQHAWEALRACIEIGRFSRGGDVDGDISRLQRVRMPVFTLKAAMKQPDVYKGRFVIVRAQLFDVKMDDRSATAMLAETSMRPAEAMRDSGDVYVSSYSGGSSYKGSSSGSGQYQTDRYGSGRGSHQSSGEGSYSSSGSSQSGYAKRFYENVVHTTGRQALGKLPEADPFLEPNKEFVFVARFDGARPGSEPNTVMANLSIQTYFSPGALLLE